MSPETPDSRRWRPGLAAAGLTGALLTLYPPISPRVQAANGLEILPGVWLGLALAAYFWIAGERRSLPRALAITALSAAAYWFAFLTAGFIELWLIGTESGVGRSGLNLHPQSMFAGGVVGGLVLAASVFFLYGAGAGFPGGRVALCTVAGGVLGVAGDTLGDALKGGSQGDAWTLATLFLVWQTGIGVLLSFIWPSAEAPGPVPAPASAARSGRFGFNRVRVLVGAILVIVAAIPIYSTLRGMRARQAFRQHQNAYEAYRAGHPPRTELPHVAGRPADEVMILEPIAGHHFTSQGVRVVPPNESHPERAEYLACYSTVGGSTCAGIDVRVTEYQTAEWAAYAARGVPAVGGLGIGLGTEVVVEQFGHRIYHLPGALPRREVFWVSGPYLVRITSSFHDLDPIVRAYLDRFKSSL